MFFSDDILRVMLVSQSVSEFIWEEKGDLQSLMYKKLTVKAEREI